MRLEFAHSQALSNPNTKWLNLRACTSDCDLDKADGFDCWSKTKSQMSDSQNGNQGDVPWTACHLQNIMIALALFITVFGDFTPITELRTKS